MAKGPSSPKLTDAEQVEYFMIASNNPLKPEMEALREIIKKASKKLGERIKWNAPSYYYQDDIVTFGPQRPGKIMLVFHHPLVVKIKSELLEGEYKDRRLVYFTDMKEIGSKKKELSRIIGEIVTGIDAGK
jgi:hypothetical protein